MIVRVTAAAVFALAGPAAAQGVFDMGVLTNTLTVDCGTSRPSARAVPRATPAADARLIYVPSRAAKQAAERTFLYDLGKYDPAAAKSLAVALATNDNQPIYNTMIAGSGLRANDAADAVVAYTILGWQVANADTANIASDRVGAVRRQLAPKLAAAPKLASDPARAQLGETMKLRAVLLQAAFANARSAGTTRALGDQIAATFVRDYGMNLRRLTVTSAGLTPR